MSDGIGRPRRTTHRHGIEHLREPTSQICTIEGGCEFWRNARGHSRPVLEGSFQRSVELSPVLAAMKVSEHVGMGAVRFSLGRATTESEIDFVVNRLSETG